MPVAGLTVALERDMNDEDAKSVIDAIRMIRGVAGCDPVVPDFNTYLAAQRFKTDRIEEVIRAITGTTEQRA